MLEGLETPCPGCKRPVFPLPYCQWCGVALPASDVKDELIEMQRRIHAKSKHDGHALSRGAGFKYCPFCQEKLTPS